jgi:hypothetical protein
MGMFDTIHVTPPLLCPTCGARHESLQTKEFSCVMANYKVGSLIASSPVLMGIIKEWLWCSACYKAGQAGEAPVFLVIWHSILAGVEQYLAKAEARLAAVHRLDLIAWLEEAQREAVRWQRRFRRFHNDVRRWHEHLSRAASPEPEDEDDSAANRQRA